MVLDELGAYIVLQGISGVTALGTDTFLQKIPPTPDVIASFIHYGGLADEPDLGKQAVRLEFPRIQVVCRGIRDDAAGPMTMANSIKKALAKIENQNLSGVRYLSCLCENGPFFLRRDDNDRIEIVANYQVQKVIS